MAEKVYWNTIKISDIKDIGGVGGSFKQDESHTYFTVIMKDNTKHTFHYDSRKGYEKKRELHKLFNEYNNVPETYRLENSMFIEVDKNRPILFGYRVENNVDDYEYKTLLEIEELKKQGKIIDDGWRHMLYICALKIVDKKIMRGNLTEAYKQQLDAFEIKVEV